MSTKCGIKWRKRSDDAPGFLLYEDCFETMENPDSADVYLQLEGVQVKLETQGAGAKVTVQMPRELARALGMLPAA